MTQLLINSITTFFQVVYYILLARIILSWLPNVRNTSIGQLLYSLTEPFLAPIRNIIDKSPLGGGMMIDFSPIIAFFLMDIIKNILISLISML